MLRCNGINVGARLTDNMLDADFYRYHDIFHFSHMVHLGWSPVTRALLNCKRKSKPALDENEDGARAAIVEEAVTATVFSRAKEMHYFEGMEKLDYDTLKAVGESVRGFEVAKIPLWQWETAILKGYTVFRRLRGEGGGVVELDLERRELRYLDP